MELRGQQREKRLAMVGRTIFLIPWYPHENLIKATGQIVIGYLYVLNSIGLRIVLSDLTPGDMGYRKDIFKV